MTLVCCWGPNALCLHICLESRERSLPLWRSDLDGSDGPRPHQDASVSLTLSSRCREASLSLHRGGQSCCHSCSKNLVLSLELKPFALQQLLKDECL